MKHLHFDVETDGFCGAYWRCAASADHAVIAMLASFVLSMPERPDVEQRTDYYARAMMTLALCHLDYTMSEAGGTTDFVRQYTLASGGPYCDCGYKKRSLQG